MARSLVLHIGDPKTGTSSIQEVMRHRLFEAPSVSVTYPDQLNCFPLANAIWDPKQAEHREPRYTRLAQWLEASDADVAVVSAEQFFRVDPEQLRETLIEFLPEYLPGLRILAYVRPHAGRLLSAFMQRSKAGLYQGDLPTFFERTQGENLLRYAPRFKRWAEVFGDSFTLRPMIRDQLRNGDVVTDFLDFVLKGAPFSLRGVVEANPSLPVEHLAGLREVQAILKRNAVPIGTRHSVGDHIGRTLARLKSEGTTKLQMSGDLYQDLKALCMSDAEELDRTFFKAPLMVQALEAAGADVIARNQDMSARAYYSEDTLQTLRKSARNLANMFKNHPDAWTMAFEREIGQRASFEGLKTPPPVRQHIERVNTVLTRVAMTISAPSPGLLAGGGNAASPEPIAQGIWTDARPEPTKLDPNDANNAGLIE